MAIVNKPGKEGTITLYDIPDAELQKYAIPADKAAQMFPKKSNPTKDDALSMTGPSSESDVQAYGGHHNICWYYCCDHHGCGWCWYYC